MGKNNSLEMCGKQQSNGTGFFNFDCFFRIILKYYEEIASSLCTEFVCIFYLYCGNVLLKETAQKIIVHISGDCFVYMRESAFKKNLPAALFYMSLKE